MTPRRCMAPVSIPGEVDDARRMHKLVLLVGERDVVDRDAFVLGPAVPIMNVSTDDDFWPHSVDGCQQLGTAKMFDLAGGDVDVAVAMPVRRLVRDQDVDAVRNLRV